MKNFIDYTAPGAKEKKGGKHVISKTIEEFEDIFSSFGFEIADGPEVENTFYNFDAMNVPKNHPARDMQDTFFIDSLDDTVLRTHTSSVQARYMSRKKPPIRMIAPGRVFRNETTDSTHEAQFHQVEGLVVDENISLANLKAVLKDFLKIYFENENLKIRIRPGFFPFVEPGIEVDMTCHKCTNGIKKDCSVCKGSGWIEVGGAGMVHPNVFEVLGIDSEKYQGFAFGLGIERMAMLKYGIDDIRLFYDGEVGFLKQF